jgi:8-oxo-dGTP pyrophosphatase MutT (NUDIX family)
MRFEEVAERLAVIPDRLPAAPPELVPMHVELPRRTSHGDPQEAANHVEGASSTRHAVVLPWLPGPRRHAAALVLVYPDADGEARVVLIERPMGDLRHPGEIALPGGEIEPGDADPAAAALREATEEVGIDPERDGLRVLGCLDTIEVRVSGFELVPVIALASQRPPFRPDPREVRRIIEAPVGAFVAGVPLEIVTQERRGRLLRYGAYRADGLMVWGATARALGQVGALLV